MAGVLGCVVWDSRGVTVQTASCHAHQDVHGTEAHTVSNCIV
jgi:hypothetical protein